MKNEGLIRAGHGGRIIWNEDKNNLESLSKSLSSCVERRILVYNFF